MSLSNIAHNKMRSFLTTLGVMIGVTAIIALITVMEGATTEVYSQFAALGTGKLTVSVTGTALKSGLNESNLQTLEALDNVSGVSPAVTASFKVRSDTAWEESATVKGYGASYFRNTDDLISRGRLINPLDVQERSRVCLIDDTLSEKLFMGQDPLNKTVIIGGLDFTVVGVLDSGANQDVMAQAMGGGDDGTLVMPYTTLEKLTGSGVISQLTVYLRDTDRTDDTQDALNAALNAAFNYKDDAFTIINMESLLSTMNTMMNMMTTLLAGIASIALLVGGIGIMNMMLVSVTERTSEIGLRKALGAEPWEIQLQFLIESFFLSLMGGLAGVVFGLIISYILAQFIGMAFAVSINAIALGVGFSATVGLLFGWAPARKASNLNPIDALRSN